MFLCQDRSDPNAITEFFYGDAHDMYDNARGGNDTLTGGDNSGSGYVTNNLYGDAYVLSDGTRGGNDTLTGGTSYSGTGGINNGIWGDAFLMGNAQGGDDILVGGSSNSNDSYVSFPLINFLTGDAGSFYDHAQGGDDILIGGDANGVNVVYNFLYGDAGGVSYGYGEGGNDILTGGSSNGVSPVLNFLYGEGQYMFDFSQGGDDILTGGEGFGTRIVTNTLVGDASESSSQGQGPDAQTQGGNDRLISGINATDHMWGDWQTGSGAGGSDTFVFKGAFGSDFVYDFAHAQGDLIEFQVGGVNSFDDLTIVQDGANTVITTSASEADSVTLVNYDNTISPLTASDFHFII